MVKIPNPNWDLIIIIIINSKLILLHLNLLKLLRLNVCCQARAGWCPILLKLKTQRTERKVLWQRKRQLKSGIIKFKISESRWFTEASLPPQHNSAEVSSWSWGKNWNGDKYINQTSLKTNATFKTLTSVSKIWKCNHIKVSSTLPKNLSSKRMLSVQLSRVIYISGVTGFRKALQSSFTWKNKRNQYSERGTRAVYPCAGASESIRISMW